MRRAWPVLVLGAPLWDINKQSWATVSWSCLSDMRMVTLCSPILVSLLDDVPACYYPQLLTQRIFIKYFLTDGRLHVVLEKFMENMYCEKNYAWLSISWAYIRSLNLIRRSVNLICFLNKIYFYCKSRFMESRRDRARSYLLVRSPDGHNRVELIRSQDLPLGLSRECRI